MGSPCTHRFENHESCGDYDLTYLLRWKPTCSIVVIWVSELKAEIYFKNPVRAIGKVLLMKFN